MQNKQHLAATLTGIGAIGVFVRGEVTTPKYESELCQPQLLALGFDHLEANRSSLGELK
jgi:hypothetical protein